MDLFLRNCNKNARRNTTVRMLYSKLVVSTKLLFGHKRYRKQAETFMLGKLSHNNNNRIVVIKHEYFTGMLT